MAYDPLHRWPKWQRDLVLGDWSERAACVPYPTSWFFPPRGQPVARARAVCAVCPVVAECLGFALHNRERFGVWGGRTVDERTDQRLGRGPE